MKRSSVLTAGLLIILILPLSAQSTPKADLAVINATVYTVAESQPIAQAIAIKGDRITAVGSNNRIQTWIGPDTRVIDAAGMTVTPGFIEGHGHLMGIGWSENFLDLTQAGNYEELIAMVARAVQKAKPGDWILGGGWHQSKWDPVPDPLIRGFQSHQALSRISPNNPVFLNHASGHAAFANRRAMDIAGIDATARFDQGGEIIKDENGNPTGVFVEAAQGLIAAHIPPPGPEQAVRMLELGIQTCLENGITSFHDAGVDRLTLGLLQSFLSADKLKLRLYAMLVPGRDGSDQAFIDEWLKRGPQIGPVDGFLTIRTIKLYVDGALGSRGAWLIDPYSDDPGNTGHSFLPMDALYPIIKRAFDGGFQVAAHAIGDRANHEVLNLYERVFQTDPGRTKERRFRIEHAQHISARDIPRFAELEVIAAMQGIHMASDIEWAVDRLGRKRMAEGAYVWEKLSRTGALIINGTDAPVEPVNPLASFYASVTRKTLDGKLFPWSHPDQRMSRGQALRSYTLNAAFAAFEEKHKGSIEPGKLADFTVFSQDIMRIADDRLLDTEVMYTIVGGKVMYTSTE